MGQVSFHAEVQYRLGQAVGCISYQNPGGEVPPAGRSAELGQEFCLGALGNVLADEALHFRKGNSCRFKQQARLQFELANLTITPGAFLRAEEVGCAVDARRSLVASFTTGVNVGGAVPLPTAVPHDNTGKLCVR